MNSAVLNRKSDKLNFIFKISLIILIVLLFWNNKYSARVLNYLILPISLFKVYSTKKYEKTGLEIYIGLVLGAVAISGIDAFDFKGVRDSFFDMATFMMIPIYISQFKIKSDEKKKFLLVGALAFISRLSLSFLEKWGYIQGLYNGERISGGVQVWRYAPVLMIGIVVILCLLTYRKNKNYEIAGLIALLIPTVIAIVRTQNRANWVALIVCMILGLILKFKKKSIIPILVGITFLSVMAYKNPENKYVIRLESITNLKNDNSNLGRLEHWKRAIEMFKDSPINGVGFSEKNFKNGEIEERYIHVPKIKHGHSHNNFFYVLSTMGIIGVVSYAVYMLKLLYVTFRNRNIDYGMAFFTLLSIELFGFFETPIKYLDLSGISLLLVGFLYSDYLRNKQ
ncbi:MAG: O-antigen ligase family protein [Cetobacterium sp.]|uniref:O-antigen ligase family protein n=1 Tax=Cetobacterium sp. TaxID=2071632 RepID=UPI002FCC3484